MRKETILLDYSFTTLNEYIDSERTQGSIRRKGRFVSLGAIKANNIKKTETTFVQYSVMNKYKTFDKPVKITFVWIEKNKKLDPDNICFAKKFILDGLVKGGVLHNDGHKWISGFEDEYEFGKKRAVKIIIEEV